MTYRRTVLAAYTLPVALAAGACGPKTLVVLTPSPDGTLGRIAVANAGGSVEIDAANHFTTVGAANSPPSKVAAMNEADIARIFGRALAVRPESPLHFALYFGSDSTDLLPDSAARLKDIADAIRARASEIVSVVGHSDTAGVPEYNVALSARRAEAVKAALVALGIPGSSIQVTSHGETNPLVPTGDDVKEERNRRVEVVVR
jgi:outer membrane protein OmpA-like peptidoglycan-associated protein